MPTAYERFVRKFEIDPTTNCWNWTAANDGHGYRRFYANRGYFRAHRWSYEHHTADNIIIRVDGGRGCRACHRIASRAYKAKKRASV